MKYMLIMQFPMGEWKTSRLSLWPPEDIKTHIEFLRRFNKELTDAGEFVLVNGLVEPEEAKIVRAQAGGTPAITDGPFSESKEFLAGYWIIEVANAKRAIQLAARASAAPGPGGKPLNMPIEVRQVMMHSPSGEV